MDVGNSNNLTICDVALRAGMKQAAVSRRGWSAERGTGDRVAAYGCTTAGAECNRASVDNGCGSARA